MFVWKKMQEKHRGGPMRRRRKPSYMSDLDENEPKREERQAPSDLEKILDYEDSDDAINIEKYYTRWVYNNYPDVDYKMYFLMSNYLESRNFHRYKAMKEGTIFHEYWKETMVTMMNAYYLITIYPEEGDIAWNPKTFDIPSFTEFFMKGEPAKILRIVRELMIVPFEFDIPKEFPKLFLRETHGF